VAERAYDALTWGVPEIGDALAALAAPLGARAAGVAPPATVVSDPGGLERWVTDAAAWLGVEAEAVMVSGGEIEPFALAAGPALVRVCTLDAPRFLAVRGRSGRKIEVIAPDLRVHRIDPATVVEGLLLRVDPRLLANLERTLDAAKLTGERRRRVGDALLRQRAEALRLFAGWLIRLAPSAPFLRQLSSIGAPSRVFALAVGHVALWWVQLAAWAMVGRGALSGRLEPGWLAAWALLVLSVVPMHGWLLRAEGRLALDVGALLKQRLMLGALRLRPEEVRHQGMGQLLGRVIESEAVEAAASGGALFAAFALLELLFAVGVLAQGAGGPLHAGLLVAWTVAAVVVTVVYTRRRARRSDARLSLTNDLVESLVGHRTRLAQEDPSRWHAGEDRALSGYIRASSEMDQATVWLGAALPAGWMFAGLLALGPGILDGAGAGALGVAVGGVLLAHGSLRQLVGGAAGIAGALIAWEQVRALFYAAERPVVQAPPGPWPGAPAEGEPVLEAHGVSFRHEGRAELVLDRVDLAIHPGDRLLLEGPSGGGKSTLGSLLAGLRTPGAGVLLLRGLDQRTLGADGWRRRVVTAPQFHENHVLLAPFAFNLLMGRTWPPEDADMEEATALCDELGLGPVLERMPAGMMQMVGETGWQLSHGEKSRLYIARALLQGAELVVLDESFAALDPDNLGRALECVMRRAKAVLVIAHP
jgi:ATP-binding cassette subfamily B protein